MLRVRGSFYMDLTGFSAGPREATSTGRGLVEKRNWES